jgi:hypothetical protein
VATLATPPCGFPGDSWYPLEKKFQEGEREKKLAAVDSLGVASLFLSSVFF